jgi:hypothetical protein
LTISTITGWRALMAVRSISIGSGSLPGPRRKRQLRPTISSRS